MNVTGKAVTMVAASKDPNQTVTPIAEADPARRLDAIVRRHGGTPKPAPGPVDYYVPEPKRGECKGQRRLW